MADEKALAEKIARKAEDALSALRLEMAAGRWPPEFRKIMWNAVIETAKAHASDIEAAN